MGGNTVTATDTAGTRAPAVRPALINKPTFTSSARPSKHTHSSAPGPQSVPATFIGSSRSFQGLGINSNTQAKASSGRIISPPKAIKPSGSAPPLPVPMPKPSSSSPTHGVPSTADNPARSGALKSRGTLRSLASPKGLLPWNTMNATSSPPSQQEHQRNEILDRHRSATSDSPRERGTRSDAMGIKEMRAAIPPLPSPPSYSFSTTGKVHRSNTTAGSSSSGSHTNSKPGNDAMPSRGSMPAALDCRTVSVDDILVVDDIDDGGMNVPHIQVQGIEIASPKRGFSRPSSSKPNLNTKPKSTKQQPFAPDPISRISPQSATAPSGPFRPLHPPVFLSPERQPRVSPQVVVTASTPAVGTVSSSPSSWPLLEALSPTPTQDSFPAPPYQVATAPSSGSTVSPRLSFLPFRSTLSLADEIGNDSKSTGRKRGEANVTTTATATTTAPLATTVMTTLVLQGSPPHATSAKVGNNGNMKTHPSSSTSPRPQTPNSKSKTLIHMIATKFRPRSRSPSPSAQRKEGPGAGAKSPVAAITPMGAVLPPPASSHPPNPSSPLTSVPGSPPTPQLNTVLPKPLLTLRSSSSRLLNSKPSKTLVPAPGATPAAKEARDAALREMGLLPPLKGHMDLSRQEREQDALIPVVNPPPPEGTTGSGENGAAEREGASAAGLIKKQWEEKNKVVAQGTAEPKQDVERKQRERLISFKFGGAPPPLEIRVDVPAGVDQQNTHNSEGRKKDPEEIALATQTAVPPVKANAPLALASPHTVVSLPQSTGATALTVDGVNPLATPLPPSAPVVANAVELMVIPPGSSPNIIVSAESGDGRIRAPGTAVAAMVTEDDNTKPHSEDASATTAVGVPPTSSQAQLQASISPTGSDSGHSIQSRASTSVTPSLDQSIQTLTDSTLHTSEFIGNGAASTGPFTKSKSSELAATRKAGEVLEAIVEDTADISGAPLMAAKTAIVEQATNSLAFPSLPIRQSLQPNRGGWEPVSVQRGIPSTPSTQMGLSPTRRFGNRMSFNIFGKWGNNRDTASATPNGSPALSTSDSAAFSSPGVLTPDENSAPETSPTPSLSPTTPGVRKRNAVRSFTGLGRSVVTWSKPKKNAPLMVNTDLAISMDANKAASVAARTTASPQGQQGQLSDALGKQERPEGSLASVPVVSGRASSVAPILSTTSTFSAPAFPGALPGPNRMSLSPALHRPSSVTFLNRSRGTPSTTELLSTPMLRPRQSVSPTLHSRGSILMQVGGIDDDETRRVTELAFLV